MSNHKGFTLVELVITISLIGIFSTVFLIAFRSSIFGYLGLQKQAVSFGQLSSQAERITNVLRGATTIQSAADNDLTVYAYFYPSDAYVSQVRYYVVTENGQKRLMADLTPMTANPPQGTLNTAKKKTFVIIDNFYQPQNGKLFSYLNTGGVVVSTPIPDLQVVKSIQVNLASKLDDGGDQTISLRVLLRNKKNNL